MDKTSCTYSRKYVLEIRMMIVTSGSTLFLGRIRIHIFLKGEIRIHTFSKLGSAALACIPNVGQTIWAYCDFSCVPVVDSPIGCVRRCRGDWY